MVFAMLCVGTVAGFASALLAVLAIGAPVWTGLLVWSGLGTVVMLAGICLPLLRRDTRATARDRHATA